MNSDRYALDLPVQTGSRLYIYGGYNSVDKGVPDWGANCEHDALLIGDTAGWLVITCEPDTVYRVPLMFGYTVWWHERWNDAMLPFKGPGSDPEAAACLHKTLHLYGGFEGNDTGVLCVQVQGNVISVEVENNPEKMGHPVFYRANWDCADENAVKFFDTHTINAASPFTPEIKAGVDRLFGFLHHSEDELKDVIPSEAPKEFNSPGILFSGTYTDEIRTNVLRDNCWDLNEKIDPDGRLNASTKGGYCWGRYDGFGTWIAGNANFYGKAYSRDGGRAIMSLIDAGYLDEAGKVLDYYNECLMYFPREYPKLTFGGKKIPGHWTVVVNEPMLYSTYLTTVGWPTRYTQKRFGDEYQNLGNLETDGHGLVMLATYKYYLARGRDAEYVRSNWEYIREAAEFLVWCLDNPELSLSENDVLYGETEAAMNDYTLYANIPCCLALLFYAEMASSIGRKEETERWRIYHSRMAAGIERRFAVSIDGLPGWNLSHCGFYHDPVITMMADIYGHDLRRFPYPEWVERSRNTYRADLARFVKDTYVGPRGLGYDFNMIAQNALLLDETKDYGQFMSKLSRICYAPKMYRPYLTPEGITVLNERGIYRREGDLGNLVQQAETIKTVLMTVGIAQLPDGTVLIAPRLPDRSNLKANNIRVANSAGITADLDVSFSEDGAQHVGISLHGAYGLPAVFRAGPFGSSHLEASQSGKAFTPDTYKSGDAFWADIPLDTAEDMITLRIHAKA